MVLRSGVVAEQLPEPVRTRGRQAAVDQLGEEPEQMVGLGGFLRHRFAANRLSMHCINCFLILASETFIAASDLPTRLASSRIESPEP